ncbi:4-hydroxyphenylacetate 3-hydroxylase family protein [Xenorhabdus szentirmaii]|uniref:4-hydroxyphenylacetate 3-monooxygenase n=1 Tax=Xenorhabdus szentirmaii TaxID=290112 RepID=A0AAW3YWU0_9GAMM|nr:MULTISPECIES: 4-hydroxyphenylacetate 3-hydroxylase N-terminal domain-containing protein [Xenorhabdus]MBD2780793.1 4-hydroxyphenylacetate 3-monooxygenase [Xenorhabdus sp. 38]MBD2791840.1 4-hydroxyphenylacetate 3-monooxygenase [Xenorhabdus sp. CUL]MBD2801366.1 4-hydroxyphenylacetate 3-monooxygenase [Xenorhabdus sp. M]MBD2824597.1 4-hydroxyphenylacetate 3-monooxygenase [Xenorhabdus sp. 5]PHM42892.1 paerucumarin biosynthesis protein PvcC [Xenorhabdus szentirmaii]
MIRTGERYLDDMRDGRTIFINGEKITNHVDHPAFKNAIRSVARLYDYKAEHTDKMAFKAENGELMSLYWQLPTTPEKLIARGQAAYEWARQTMGWLGRTPDYVAAALTGMITHIELFESYSQERADALRNYFSYVSENDLYLSYALINPQGDRSKTPGEHTRNLYHTLGVVEKNTKGIIVRGTKMLATGAVLADEILVGSHKPLKPGIDERYALSFALPLNTKGIKIISRKSYEFGINPKDYPISSQFDETDSMIYFDDVLVPWERVFVFEDIEMIANQLGSTMSEAMMDIQSLARYVAKLHFLAGLAQSMVEVNGVAQIPAVKESLAQLACYAVSVEALFNSVLHCPKVHNGFYLPDKTQLDTYRVLSQSIYPKVLEIIRKLAGGGVLMLPSSEADLENDEILGIIEKAQYSSLVSPVERVRMMKLVWDVIGSEFASRHHQYELFYAGAEFQTLGRLYNQYDWGASKALVEKIKTI